METLIKTRQEANILLSSVISILARKYKDLRYIQILWSIGIIDSDSSGTVIDRFYEEPIDTLKRCYDNIIKILYTTNSLYLKEEIDKLINK